MYSSDIPNDELTDYAPEELFGESFPLLWQMTRQEKFSLISLLRVMAPDVAIEVGTDEGGSLQVLSRYSKNVFSIDINPNVPTTLRGHFPNVEFRTGDSAELLPSLIAELNRSTRQVGFVLIDADHTEHAVWQDVTAALSIRPKRPVCIVMHDAFHPPCRRGLRRVNWKSNPFVHYVELDFTSGVLVPGRESAETAMFGGLALTLMLPVERDFELDVFESQARLFEMIPLSGDISPVKPS